MVQSHPGEEVLGHQVVACQGSDARPVINETDPLAPRGAPHHVPRAGGGNHKYS